MCVHIVVDSVYTCEYDNNIMCISIPQAIKEPKYSIAYANLYKVMNTIKVESTTEDERPQVVFFRRVVLSKLQFEFEKNKEDDEEREGLLRAIEAAQDVSSTK